MRRPVSRGGGRINFTGARGMGASTEPRGVGDSHKTMRRGIKEIDRPREPF